MTCVEPDRFISAKSAYSVDNKSFIVCDNSLQIENYLALNEDVPKLSKSL